MKGRPFSMEKNKKRMLLNVVLTILIAVTVICIFIVTQYYYDGYRYRKEQKQIAEMIHGGIVPENAKTAVGEINSIQKEDKPQKTVRELYKIPQQPEDQPQPTPSLWQEQYQTLVSANQDCVGFLEIPGTAIQFPVMFTPGKPEKYLYRDFFGKSEKRGTPFLDSATVLGESQNYIIYGHNMKDGSVFGTLPSYLDQDYCEEHKLIYFNTAVSEGVYEVVAVCKTEVLAKVSEDFKYYQYGGPLSKPDFEEYVRNIREMSVCPVETEINWGDELLTLSTCYHRRAGDDGRLIIVTKKIS